GVQQQTREHIFLIRTLGINQLIVAINKMDEETVKYSQDRFEELKAEVSDLLKKVGYDVSKIPFVPTSGWEGDNVVKKSENMPWYKGPTIYELLDKLQPPPKPIDKPLRIPIQDVYTITGVGVVPVGRVESGVLKPNTKIIVEPIGEIAEVKSIEMHHERLEQAVPGDNIGFNIKGIEKRKLKRGMVVGYPDNPPTVAKEFTAQIIVMQHPTAIAPGYTPVIHIHTATMACEIYEFVDKRDPKTGAVIEKSPKYLKAGDSAVVKMRPIKPLVVEKFKDFPALGRFAIRDMGMTIGAGIVLEVVPVEKKSK
ncbi:MAG TPA: elongation factor 1-alpha, partial [Candidatus Bathyarchaeota archaeon]|nr:elongation factor 1-alpha [Candidatus Bathyarchaeota archaeon]